MTDKIAMYALDVVIVVCLTTLAAIGKLDAIVVVGIVGPMVGAKVASHVKSGDNTSKLPPSALMLLGVGVAKLLGASSRQA